MKSVRIYTTADGVAIHLTEENEKHLEAHAGILGLLEEAIGKMTVLDAPADLQFVVRQIDLGRPLGSATMVGTPVIGLDDNTKFCFRSGRNKPSRIVFCADLPPVSTVVIVVGKDGSKGEWCICSAYIGTPAPDEPFFAKTDEILARSLEHWCSHALVYEWGWDRPYSSTWRQELTKFGINV